ncbi:MAG TPA: hypothetical protein VMX18_01650 [Candidatus Bipolaricaulota bacterium]|nr:hypothetical protein [Candidatus Bipolaricaulota bacterium]
MGDSQILRMRIGNIPRVATSGGGEFEMKRFARMASMFTCVTFLMASCATTSTRTTTRRSSNEATAASPQPDSGQMVCPIVKEPTPTSDGGLVFSCKDGSTLVCPAAKVVAAENQSLSVTCSDGKNILVPPDPQKLLRRQSGAVKGQSDQNQTLEYHDDTTFIVEGRKLTGWEIFGITAGSAAGLGLLITAIVCGTGHCHHVAGTKKSYYGYGD